MRTQKKEEKKISMHYLSAWENWTERNICHVAQKVAEKMKQEFFRFWA